MLVISKRKTRQWKQVLYFLVYIYLCDRKELNNTLAALFLIEKKPEYSWWTSDGAKEQLSF